MHRDMNTCIHTRTKIDGAVHYGSRMTYIHTHTHTHIHTCRTTYIHTHTCRHMKGNSSCAYSKQPWFKNDIHTYTHTYMQNDIHTHTYTYMQAHEREIKLRIKQAAMVQERHTYTHTHIHAERHAYIHTYIHAGTRKRNRTAHKASSHGSKTARTG
jgi:hypothetical protein